MHPAGLRGSSLPYARYARSSRLAGRAGAASNMSFASAGPGVAPTHRTMERFTWSSPALNSLSTRAASAIDTPGPDTVSPRLQPSAVARIAAPVSRPRSPVQYRRSSTLRRGRVERREHGHECDRMLEVTRTKTRVAPYDERVGRQESSLKMRQPSAGELTERVMSGDDSSTSEHAVV